MSNMEVCLLRAHLKNKNYYTSIPILPSCAIDGSAGGGSNLVLNCSFYECVTLTKGRYSQHYTPSNCPNEQIICSVEVLYVLLYLQLVLPHLQLASHKSIIV